MQSGVYSRHFRKIAALALWLCLSSLSPFAVGEEQRRVIVLGFDGIDPVLTRNWIDAGELPNLSRLADVGTFTALATSNPAQSPVAWSSFATGKNPGKHNIFGFLRPGPEYHPRLALADVQYKSLLPAKVLLSALAGLAAFIISWAAAKVRKKKISRRFLGFAAAAAALVAACGFYCMSRYLPRAVPFPVSLKKGPSVWTVAGENGVKTVVLQAPIAFPAEKVPGGRLLCGFGTPDMAGTNGLWFRYSASLSSRVATETGGWKIPLAAAGDGWTADIPGPRNLLGAEESERLTEKLKDASPAQIRDIQNRLARLKKERYLTAVLHVRPLAGKLRITIGGESQTLSCGDWSDWFTIPFAVSPLLTLKGMARLTVLAVDPVELYLTPVQFHPEYVPATAPISCPADFSGRVAREVGLYPTLGWCEATNALKDEEIGEQAFWEDLKYIMEAREKVFLAELKKEDWRLFLAFFYVPDRASHMYWRFIDQEHPRHRDIEEVPAYRDNLLRVYRWMDSLVGEAMKKIRGEDVLIVLSDHGFAPFRWGVNINTFLYEEGYLALAEDAADRRLQIADLYEPGALGRNIDWSRTRAYSMGLGKIFINLKGRDPQGTVPPGEYRNLCEEIRGKLTRLTHEGRPVVCGVYLRDEIYDGPCVADAPDIVLGFHRGYRVSWQTTLGAVPREVIEPNLLKWSGDHCSVDPKLIPGVLFSNRKVVVSDPHLEDLAPTILSLLHIRPPADMNGRSLIP